MHAGRQVDDQFDSDDFRSGCEGFLVVNTLDLSESARADTKLKACFVPDGLTFTVFGFVDPLS